MFRILPATKDTYITNRVIRNTFRATDTNVGQAGTLDLFKLAGESNFIADGPFISGTTEPIELSRILIKFDLNPLRALTGSILDITHPSFKCMLQMYDVLGGQTLPSNFRVIAFPLSKSFDEGVGMDVIAFEDIGATNYITASVSGDMAVTWSQSGANAQGFIGQQNIDVMTGSAAVGNVFATQLFETGAEDLSIDVTKIVSATLVGLLPDHGFRISFSGTQETDGRTRFVKRFATRHSTNTRIRPRIFATFDDSIQDNSQNFYFDVSGSLFLNSFIRGQPANIVSGSALTQITGSDSLIVTLTSGSVSGTFTKSVFASQHQIGNNYITGIYSASFAIPSNNNLLSGAIINYGSATFDVAWGSIDGTVPFHSSTLVIQALQRTSFLQLPEGLKVSITNMRDVYKSSESVRFRVYAQDDGFNFIFSKLPIEEPSVVFDKMFYQIIDTNSDEIIVPFDTMTNSTKLSTDSDGMFFDIYMGDLQSGRTYAIDLLLIEGGTQQIFEHVRGSFQVDM